MISWLGKWIFVITDEDMDDFPRPVRMFALWCNDESLARLESKYTITNMLVLPWVPNYEIKIQITLIQLHYC